MTIIKKTTYTADAITVIEGLDHVRKRPGMYVGGTGSMGLHHLIWEILDNSIDEASNGFADTIEVVLNTDGSIKITDNGRGIPVGKHKEKKISAARLVFEVLGAGGKFEGKNYKATGGLHGVGASVVNALSEWLVVEVKDGKKKYEIRYNKGVLIQDLKVIGKSSGSGTTVSFLPDKEIFDSIEFKDEVIKNKLRELAFLNKNLLIHFKNKKKNKEVSFKYKGGISEFVEYLNEGKDIINKKPIYLMDSLDGVEVELAMQYTKNYSDNIISYVNNINTIEGGTHDVGFRLALTKAFNDFIKTQSPSKKETNVLIGDITEGLTAILSIKMSNTQFEGQTKTKLGNPEAKNIIYNILYKAITSYLQSNKKSSKEILDKIFIAKESREAAKKARDIARQKNKLTKPSAIFVSDKLANCSSKNPKECEIYLVEGESAGGSGKQARSRKTQAIFTLKGKPTNVEKKNIKYVLGNLEYATLIKAIGGGIGSDFNIKDVNYHKIIIMTDADVDGSHIRLILLTFFYRYMRPLIDEGYIYIANPPLYKVANSKEYIYAYNDKELEKAKAKIKNYTIQRYKGLGEMNPDQLWNTTMDPQKRILSRVNIDDAVMADKLFMIFMGDKPEPRKVFLKDRV